MISSFNAIIQNKFRVILVQFFLKKVKRANEYLLQEFQPFGIFYLRNMYLSNKLAPLILGHIFHIGQSTKHLTFILLTIDSF